MCEGVICVGGCGRGERLKTAGEGCNGDLDGV